MRANNWIAAAFVCAGALGFCSEALAAGTELPMYLAKPGDINVNGVLKEWGNPFTPLSQTVQGSPAGCKVEGALAYDDQWVYIAGEVTDKSFVRTGAFGPNEDHAVVVLTFPDEQGQYRTLYELEIYAGVPGKSAGQVKARGLGVVSTATLVEMKTSDGYDFEVKVPWNLFPPAARVRTGIRGAMLYYNATGGSISGVIGTVDKTSPAASLPWMPTACEQSLKNGLLRDRGITTPPQFDFKADVAGDAMKESVLVYDRYLVVLGPHYRNGTEYFYSDLEADASAGMVPMFDVKEVTNDGKAEIVMRKRVNVGAGWRELFAVLGFDAQGSPKSIFEHETGLSSSVGTIQNDVRVNGRSIVFSLGTATGYNSGNYHEPTDTDRAPMLLPWGAIKSQTYEWSGKEFKLIATEKKAAGDNATPSGPPAPPAPRPPSQEELLDQVFNLYKSERKIPAGIAPRFDFVTNVAEDERTERVLAHDRDIVVFGKGFKEGRGYVYVTLTAFQEAKDIIDMTARDMTGDGLADIIVRGVQTTKAPEEMGAGDLVREVLFIYTVSPQGIARVFAAETALSLGDKRMQGIIAFLAGKSGLDIEIRPGRSVGWDRSTWPYKQDTESVSGLEPLLLPWTTQPVRYRFGGDRYSR
ncbi:MAG: hypothetical protein HY898_27750 [Deltaproteobacteria bacterium]|nr:hypothetical protein [Deltaproteobacteria bacterium]